MDSAAYTTPQTLDEAHTLLGEFADALVQKNQEIDRLQEQIRHLLAQRFGRQADAVDPNQLNLFNEAEQDTDDITFDASEPDTESVETITYQRQKPSRRPLPEHLPRVRIEHDIAEDEKICACGTQRHVIGETVSEQLDIVPAQVQVLQHVRLRYGCRQCESGVTEAPLPPQPLPKTQASPGLLAFIATSKYTDALPLYRQSRIFKRHGIELHRQTLARWMIQCGALLLPLLNLIREAILDSHYIHVDETRVQVLKERDRDPSNLSWVWVMVSTHHAKSAAYFTYSPHRNSATADALLADFSGYLQTDDYAAYYRIGKREDITHLGCMAHARRKFTDIIKSQKKGHKKAGKATMALAYIGKLYAIERVIKAASTQERLKKRETESIPVLTAFKAWLDKALLTAPPKSQLGKALSYAHKNWENLCRYTLDGQLSIDNNVAERAIRPFAIGRKNWMFSDTPRGADASAALYSMIETAKLNGLEPYHYLKHVFTHLPAAETLEDTEALLPWNLKSVDLLVH